MSSFTPSEFLVACPLHPLGCHSYVAEGSEYASWRFLDSFTALRMCRFDEIRVFWNLRLLFAAVTCCSSSSVINTYIPVFVHIRVFSVEDETSCVIWETLLQVRHLHRGNASCDARISSCVSIFRARDSSTPRMMWATSCRTLGTIFGRTICETDRNDPNVS